MPYRVWLPEAMAAPTPVSALVHSSTLVTAGVYLVFQFHLLNEVRSLGFAALTGLRALRLLVSSTAALVSQDIKKVVALSTLRQISFMMLALGLGLPALALFHLITHARFKSCLFLRVGALLHLSASSQETRVGYSSSRSWALYSSIAVRLLALRGLPFLSAYYSKETAILLRLELEVSFVALFVFLTGALFTLLYSLRFIGAVSIRARTLKSNLVDTQRIHG